MQSNRNLVHQEITKEVLAAFFAVYNRMNFGFLESVYKRALSIEFKKRGINFEVEVAIPVFYEGEQVGFFRADHVVEGKVAVESKTVLALHPKHDSQILNQLRASGMEVGLLLNFGPDPSHQRFYNPHRPQK